MLPAAIFVWYSLTEYEVKREINDEEDKKKHQSHQPRTLNACKYQPNKYFGSSMTVNVIKRSESIKGEDKRTRKKFYKEKNGFEMIRH